MKNLITAVAILLSLGATAQTNWAIDNAHTSVKFSVTHMKIAQVEGRFTTFSGTITSSKEDFTDAKIDFTVDVNSINTANEMRDKHLKGDDFFNAEKYPNMTFKSMTLKKVAGDKYKLEGDLTIRDVTKKVSLDVSFNGTAKDPQGNTKAGFHVTGVIDRFDYNLKWNKLAEAGPVVGKDVTLNIDIELKKQ
jgi:polyisoprenoid-binding protein YceI